MKIKVIIHEEDGGYWAEVPSMPGCFTQGDTHEELMFNIREAIEGWLLVDTEMRMKEKVKEEKEYQNINLQEIVV